VAADLVGACLAAVILAAVLLVAAVLAVPAFYGLVVVALWRP
jgi:hypothetical protein